MLNRELQRILIMHGINGSEEYQLSVNALVTLKESWLALVTEVDECK